MESREKMAADYRELECSAVATWLFLQLGPDYFEGNINYHIAAQQELLTLLQYLPPMQNTVDAMLEGAQPSPMKITRTNAQHAFQMGAVPSPAKLNLYKKKRKILADSSCLNIAENFEQTVVAQRIKTDDDNRILLVTAGEFIQTYREDCLNNYNVLEEQCQRNLQSINQLLTGAIPEDSPDRDDYLYYQERYQKLIHLLQNPGDLIIYRESMLHLVTTLYKELDNHIQSIEHVSMTSNDEASDFHRLNTIGFWRILFFNASLLFQKYLCNVPVATLAAWTNTERNLVALDSKLFQINVENSEYSSAESQESIDSMLIRRDEFASLIATVNANLSGDQVALKLVYHSLETAISQQSHLITVTRSQSPSKKRKQNEIASSTQNNIHLLRFCRDVAYCFLVLNAMNPQKLFEEYQRVKHGTLELHNFHFPWLADYANKTLWVLQQLQAIESAPARLKGTLQIALDTANNMKHSIFSFLNNLFNNCKMALGELARETEKFLSKHQYYCQNTQEAIETSQSFLRQIENVFSMADDLQNLPMAEFEDDIAFISSQCHIVQARREKLRANLGEYIRIAFERYQQWYETVLTVIQKEFSSLSDATNAWNFLNEFVSHQATAIQELKELAVMSSPSDHIWQLAADIAQIDAVTVNQARRRIMKIDVIADLAKKLTSQKQTIIEGVKKTPNLLGMVCRYLAYLKDGQDTALMADAHAANQHLNRFTTLIENAQRQFNYYEQHAKSIVAAHPQLGQLKEFFQATRPHLERQQNIFANLMVLCQKQQGQKQGMNHATTALTSLISQTLMTLRNDDQRYKAIKEKITFWINDNARDNPNDIKALIQQFRMLCAQPENEARQDLQQWLDELPSTISACQSLRKNASDMASRITSQGAKDDESLDHFLTDVAVAALESGARGLEKSASRMQELQDLLMKPSTDLETHSATTLSM